MKTSYIAIMFWFCLSSDHLIAEQQISFERIRQLLSKKDEMWKYIFTCLEHGADINIRDDNGQSLLFYTTALESEQITQLIKQGIDVNLLDIAGNTALEWFCDQHIRVLEDIPSFDGRIFYYGTPLPGILNRNAYIKKTPILCYDGQKKYLSDQTWNCIALLINAGARFSPLSRLIYEVFYYAIENGHFEIAKMIYEKHSYQVSKISIWKFISRDKNFFYSSDILGKRINFLHEIGIDLLEPNTQGKTIIDILFQSGLCASLVFLQKNTQTNFL